MTHQAALNSEGASVALFLVLVTLCAAISLWKLLKDPPP